MNRVTTSETAAAEFVQAADEIAYHIAIDDAFLTGSGRRLATQFLRDAMYRGEIEPSGLPLTVTYRSDAGEYLGEQTIELLLLPDLRSADGNEMPGDEAQYIAVTRSTVQSVFTRWVRSFEASRGYSVLLEILALLLAVGENGTMLADDEIPPVRERLGGLVIDGSQDAIID